MEKEELEIQNENVVKNPTLKESPEVMEKKRKARAEKDMRTLAYFSDMDNPEFDDIEKDILKTGLSIPEFKKKWQNTMNASGAFGDEVVQQFEELDSNYKNIYDFENSVFDDFSTHFQNGLNRIGYGLGVAIPGVVAAFNEDNDSPEWVESWVKDMGDWFEDSKARTSDASNQSFFETGSLRAFAGGLGSGLASMAPMLLNFIPVVGKAAYMATTFADIFGSVLHNGKDNGLSLEDSARMALLLSPAITALEKVGMEGVVGSVGKGSVNKFFGGGVDVGIKKLAKNGFTKEAFEDTLKVGLKDIGIFPYVKKKAGQYASGFAKGAATEGVTESLQSILEQTGEQLFDTYFAEQGTEVGKGKYGTDFRSKDFWLQAAEEGFYGAILGGVISGGGNISQGLKEESTYHYIRTSLENNKPENIKALKNYAAKQQAKGKITEEELTSYVANVEQMVDYHQKLWHKLDNPAAKYQSYNNMVIKDKADNISNSEWLINQEANYPQIKKEIDGLLIDIKKDTESIISAIATEDLVTTELKKSKDKELKGYEYNPVIENLIAPNLEKNLNRLNELVPKELSIPKVYNEQAQKEGKLNAIKNGKDINTGENIKTSKVKSYGKTYSPSENIKLTDKVLKDKAGFTNMFNEASELEGEQREAKAKEIEETYGIDRKSINWLSENIEFEPSTETEVQENKEETTTEEVIEDTPKEKTTEVEVQENNTETQKADIERRRQEEKENLREEIKNSIVDKEDRTKRSVYKKDKNITEIKNGKVIYIGNTITTIEINDKGDVVLRQPGGFTTIGNINEESESKIRMKIANMKGKDAIFIIKKEYITEDKINAKYDAEIAALETEQVKPESNKAQEVKEEVEVKETDENLKQEESLIKKTDENLNKEDEVEEIKETSYSELTDSEIQSELETNENLTPEQRKELISEQSKRATKKQDVENQITESFLNGGGLDSILDGLEQRSPYEIANEKLLVRNNPELYQKIKEHFAKIFPHIPVHEVDNLGEKYGAKILARVVERGIEIDPNEAIQTSLIHEYTHIFLEILGDNHPLVQLGYQTIEGSQFDKDAQALYPDKSRKEQLNEALTEALATDALEKLRTKLDGSNLDKFLAFAKRFWKRIKRYFTGAKLDNVNDILSDALVFNNKPHKVNLSSLIGINKNQLNRSTDKKFIKTRDLVQRIFTRLKLDSIEKGIEFKQRSESFVSKNIMAALYKLYLSEKSGNKEIETKLFDGVEIDNVKELSGLSFEESIEAINNFDEQLKSKDKTLYDNVKKLTKELFSIDINVSSITEEDFDEDTENQDSNNDDNAVKASKKINNSVQSLLSSLLDDRGKRINPDVVFSYITRVSENTYGVKGLYEKLEKDASKPNGIIANAILSISKGLSEGQKAGFDQVISSLISEQSEAINLNYKLNKDGKPEKFTFRNHIVNKDDNIGDTRKNFEKARNIKGFLDYFNGNEVAINPRIFVDKDPLDLDYLAHYLGQLFGVQLEVSDIINLIENTTPTKRSDGSYNTKEQTLYNTIFGQFESIKTFLNKKQDRNDEAVEWKNITGYVEKIHNQFSQQSLLQRNYLNGRGNAESSIKLGHWASDLISMLKNDDVTGRMTEMLNSPIYKNNSVLKYFKDKRINWAKLDSVKNLAKDEVIDYSMTNANDYQILQAVKYFSNTGDGFYKQSIGVISNRDGMLLFEVPKYSLSELRKEYVKQRDYLQDLLNKQMEGLDASQKKKLIKDFNNLYIYKADSTGNVSIPNEQFIEKEVKKIASILKKHGMYNALNIKESSLKEYFLTEALNRTYLSDIFTGPALYHSNPNSGKGAVESFVKRMSGLNSNGNNIELKNPVTIVIFDGKKSGITYSDSFGMYSKNLNKEISDFTGSFSPVGINAKNNIFQTDAIDGRNLYVKSSNVNSNGNNLKGLGDVYGKAEEVLNKIEEYLGENANVMLIDSSAMKGTYKYSKDDVLDLDTLIDAAEKGTIEAIANKFHTVKVSSMKSPFNLNKKIKELDKQTAIFSTQAMLVQFNNDFSKINKFEQAAVKYLLNKMGGKTPMDSRVVKWLLNTDNTNADMLSGMGNREKSVTTEILLAIVEHNKNNPNNKITSYDHPSLRLIYEQHVASSLGKSGIKIDLAGNFMHQIPDLENNLEHDEVMVSYKMFADTLDEAKELLKKTKEAGNELKVAVVRIPASSEVSMFAGKVKGFLDTDASIVKLSNGFVRTSGSDHDGDKAMVYRQEMDKDGNFKPYSLMSQMFNQFYENLSSEAFVNRSVNNDLEFDVLRDLVNQEVNEAVEEVKEKKESNDIKDFVNHSGGAIGSDTEWDIIGSEFGMTNNKHYWVETKTPKGNTEISKQDFEEGRFESAKAAKRNFGYQYSAMKDSRLIRNWSQVKHSESVFAIGSIVGIGEKLFPKQINDTRTAINPSVTGGTGYAVGMAINNNKPVYVFNQTKGSYDIGWYKYDKNINDFIKVEIPILTQNFAGIGTREINDLGKQAIRDVYKKTTSKKEEKPGVSELFESNPELANAVYEALGFGQLKEPKVNDIVTLEFYFEKEDKIVPVKVKITELEKFYQGASTIKDNQGNIIKQEKGTLEYFLTLEKLDGSKKYEVSVGEDGYINQFVGGTGKTRVGTNNYIPEFDLSKSQITPEQKQITNESTTKETTYKSGSINDIVDIAQKMKFGGQAVGRFAIASKLMSLLSSYNAKIKSHARFNFKGKDITNFTNKNLDDVALLLQAALDIGNDPILTETGFTETTVDIGNAMLLSGIDKEEIIPFLKSKDIQELTNDFISDNSVFNTNEKKNFKTYLNNLIKQGGPEISHEELIELHGKDVADYLMFYNISKDLSSLISFIQLDKSLPNNAQLTSSILKSIEDFKELSFEVDGLMNRELYKHRLGVLSAQQHVYEKTLLSSNPEIKDIIERLSDEVNNSFELEKKYQGQIEQYLSQKFLKKKRDNVSDFIYSFSKKMEAIYNRIVLDKETSFEFESGADIQALYEIGLVSEEGFNFMMENYKDLDTNRIMKELKEYDLAMSSLNKSEVFRGNSFFNFLTFREVDGGLLMGVKKDFKATDDVLNKFREDFKKIQELDPDLANDIFDYQLYRHGTNNKIGSYIEGLPMDINVQSLLLGSKIINTPSRLNAVKKEISINLMAANKDMLMKLPSIEILNKYKGDKKLAVVGDVIYNKIKTTVNDKNGNPVIVNKWVKSNIGKFEADNNFTAFNTEVVKTISQSEINETKNGCK